MSQSYYLYIANRMLSSWSLRGWLVMKYSGSEFHTKSIFMDDDEFAEKTKEISPLGTVPFMIAKNGPFADMPAGQVITDSLAIAETMAEAVPHLWPKTALQRANARNLVCYIHSAIPHLRGKCPMNMSRRHDGFKVNADVKKDLKNIETLMEPLFENGHAPYRDNGNITGEYPGIVEAFLAPIASRVDTYGLKVDAKTKNYFDALLQSPALQEWLEDASEEEKKPRPRNDRYAGNDLVKAGDFPLITPRED